MNKKDILDQVVLRERGSCSNLDKLWNTLTTDNWETNPQTKILIYDCDTNRSDEDFGHIFRRTIPLVSDSIIKRGIENLFSNKIVEKAVAHKSAFVDYKRVQGTKRGEKYFKEENIINKDEKRNFCDWVCENGTADDFRNFSVVFQIIEDILESSSTMFDQNSIQR